MACTVDTDTFSHEALPDASTYIRLLEVISVDPTRDVPVHCELTTWPKTDAPEYRAISYTWGDPRLLAVILVNGKQMTVRRNCEDVLRQPCRNKGGYFWIDAICINQEDNHEKTFQVASMGEVYRDARQVLACVGRHGGDSDFLLETLHKHRHGFKMLSDNLPIAGGVQAYLHRMMGSEVDLERVEDALGLFFRRAYFQRVWIYQELFFGNDVQLCCEDHAVDLSSLWALYGAIRTQTLSPLGPGVPSRMSVRQSHYFFDQNDSAKFMLGAVREKRRVFFSHLVHVSRQLLQCEDPRDRIFGTLAMIDWQGEAPIQPDYGKDPFDLAVEVLQRVGDGYRDLLVFVLQDTVRVGHLLGLPDRPSRRLADEIHARRSSMSLGPRVDAAGMDTRDDSELTKFWCYRIDSRGTTWRINLRPSKEAVDGVELGAGGPESQPNHSRSPTVSTWSKGAPWDIQNTDVLLPEDTQPQDWLLIPDLTAIPRPEPPVALVARDHPGGQPQLVGKALFAACREFPWKSFQNEGFDKCGVYLDHEDTIVLAHTCNWRAWAEPFFSNEDEPHMLQVDDYFETSLCGQRSRSYATWIES